MANRSSTSREIYSCCRCLSVRPSSASICRCRQAALLSRGREGNKSDNRLDLDDGVIQELRVWSIESE